VKEEVWAECLRLEFETFLLVPQQPRQLWTNRDNGRI